MQITKLIFLLGLLLAAGCRTPARQPAGPESGAPPLEPLSHGRESAESETQGIERRLTSAATHQELSTRLAAGGFFPGTPAPRTGDEIVVAGQLFHTGTPVVLWLDPGGYDAYRVERRFSEPSQASWQATQDSGAGLDSPNRYDTRGARLNADERERVRGGGWDLPTLQRCVDQFVIHYDAAGTSRQCFKVLHDLRNLSVHFLLDLDGTIYQTLDVKERARHASGVNDRSVGIEIANIGAYPTNATGPLGEWYQRDADGQTRVTIPARFGEGGLRTTHFIARPARAEAVTNSVQGKLLVQYDFTSEQYAALARLTAALCRVLPEIKCEVPRNAAGQVPTEKLADEQLEQFRGVLGHYHLTTNKVDPGPAFEWDKTIDEARRLMREGVSGSPERPR